MISLDGRSASKSQLPALLSAVAAKTHSEVAIEPGRLTPYGQVVQSVALLNTLKFCDFSFVGNERWAGPEYYSKRDAVASGLTAPLVPPFAKVIDQVIVLDNGPATAKGKRNGSSCRMLVRGKPADLDEAITLSFKNLDVAIKYIGGPERAMHLLAQQGPTALPAAIIQAKATLPWHCAAGAIYAAQVSGYPLVDLVVLPE